MDLIKRLYCIHSPFYREWPMICFIREYIREHVPEAEVRMDSWGNLYIKKGESDGYPTLVCHLDQVQELHSEDFEVRKEGDILYGWNKRTHGIICPYIENTIYIYGRRLTNVLAILYTCNGKSLNNN